MMTSRIIHADPNRKPHRASSQTATTLDAMTDDSGSRIPNFYRTALKLQGRRKLLPSPRLRLGSASTGGAGGQVIRESQGGTDD